MIKKLVFVNLLFLFTIFFPFKNINADTLVQYLTPNNNGQSGYGGGYYYANASTTITDVIIPMKCVSFPGTTNGFYFFSLTNATGTPINLFNVQSSCFNTTCSAMYWSRNCVNGTTWEYRQVTLPSPVQMQSGQWLHMMAQATSTIKSYFGSQTPYAFNNNLYNGVSFGPDLLQPKFTSNYLPWGILGATSTVSSECEDCQESSASSTNCSPVFLGSNHINLVSKYLYLGIFVSLFGALFLVNRYEHTN